MDTTWLSVLGLSLEIAGLAALFFDLLRSKRIDSTREFLKNMNDDLETSSRELILRTYGGLVKLNIFLRGYLALLEFQAKAERDAAEGKAPDITTDEDRKLHDFITGRSAVGLRTHAVDTFVAATRGMTSMDDVQEAIARNQAAWLMVLNSFNEHAAEAKRLRLVATVGVGFVLIGAAVQLFDLIR